MIDSMSNGLGGPSMLMLYMACEGFIPARISITADTGSENDRQLCDGSRISARDFFEKHVVPMCRKSRREIAPFFVRSKLKDGSEMLPLHQHMARHHGQNDNVPMYGSEGGMLRQTCTDKWKLRAIKQQLRALGAKRSRCAIGLHIDELLRRQRGIYLNKFVWRNLEYRLYQTTADKKNLKPIRWMKHFYPLADSGLGRQAVRDRLDELGVPYLITSECDHCPWQDDARWLAHTPEPIEATAQLEDRYGGEFFFTDRRIPLRLAIDEMRRNPKTSDPIFGCKNNYCGI